MLYYSTNFNAQKINFKHALLKGLADDGGLYMPEHIPILSKEELTALRNLSYPEIAFKIGIKFLKDEITDVDFRKIVNDAYDYPVPIEFVTDRQYIMRLDQGPTASFKDFAARLMGRLMQYYLSLENRKLLILTATSGDTGSAIASAFYGLNNIEVVVLFPEKEVTPRQRKQMTTLGNNVCIISINGKFDDCQALAKKAFSDPELDYLRLSSANSINIGRLIPQTMYYFYAYSILCEDDDKIIFSVPSGNFGDLMGGLIAMNMGLPVHKFIVATNENDEFPKYYNTGKYQTISPSKNCISSAMNVGHPSNVARLITLYGGRMDERGRITSPPDMDKLRSDMYATSVTDKETEETIFDVFDKFKIQLEPHGAVGWAGLQRYFSKCPHDKEITSVSLETAHPAKFPEKITELLKIEPELPPSLEDLDNKKEQYFAIDNNYAEFSDFLKRNY